MNVGLTLEHAPRIAWAAPHPTFSLQTHSTVHQAQTQTSSTFGHSTRVPQTSTSLFFKEAREPKATQGNLNNWVMIPGQDVKVVKEKEASRSLDDNTREFEHLFPPRQ